MLFIFARTLRHRFWDSDIAKWLEAACYILILQPDPSLAAQVDEVVDNIRNTQHEDGYINTYYTVDFHNQCFISVY